MQVFREVPRSTCVRMASTPCTWRTSALGSAADAEILEAASKRRRTIVTLDADFAQLLFLSNASAPSVVRFRIEGLDRAGSVSWLLRVIPLVEHDLVAGAVVSVDRVTVRVRRLPISHATP